MSDSTLHDRLSLAAGSRSYRQLADLTSTHHETVRRYMQGQSPSVEFVALLCLKLSLNATWMLTGQGPMRLSELREQTLAEADPAELLTAIADTLTHLLDRVDRIERYCQTLDTRLRGSRPTGGAANDSVRPVVAPRPRATKLGDALPE